MVFQRAIQINSYRLDGLDPEIQSAISTGLRQFQVISGATNYMGTLVYYITLSAGLIALVMPAIGIINGYACILLGPQVIWWWSFDGKRHFLVIAVCTLIGLFSTYLKGKVDFSYLKNRQNVFIFLWWIAVIISYLAGPYVQSGPGPRFFQPEYIFGIMCKAFFFYYLGVLSITDIKKLKYLCLVIVLVSIYYIFWINDRYLAGFYGRIGGPKYLNVQQYADENNFAMFFVISLPFIYYYAQLVKSKLLRYCMWLLIPLGWHGIFLTGSRGGLLGLLVTTALIVIKSPRKKLGVCLLLALLVAFLWQGGDVIKNRTATLSDESGQFESSAQGRIDAWGAATKMVLAHPITGVGIASFGTAFPLYSDKKPREAHNTYFQIAAESGVLAVFCYIFFIWHTVRSLWLKRVLATETYSTNDSEFVVLSKMRNAVLVAWVGFAVCAFFLSLQAFEQFFYLAVISNFIIQHKKTCGVSD